MWLAGRTVVTAEHPDHIPTDRLDEPAIIVEVMACRNGRPRKTGQPDRSRA
jgi:hypothetical protein